MKTQIIKISFLLLLISFFSVNAYAWKNINGGRGDFVKDTQFHLLYGGTGNVVLGDFTATGNSILYVDDGSTPSLISSHTSLKDEDPAFHATAYSMGDAEKMDSSSAKLSLPSYVQGKDIVWAGLFWQGQIYRHDGNAYSDAQVDSTAANWNSVTIKDSKGVMHLITAPLNSNNTTHKAYHHAIHDNNNGFRYSYGAYYDVTNIIKNSYSPTDNNYTVGNIKTTAGQDTGGYTYIPAAPQYSGNFQFGLYGGWSLIVVYDVSGTVAAANNVPAKNVSIFDGFDLYLTWGNGTVPFTTTINLSGFYTPKSGTINSKLLLFGGAGDKGINDDTLQLQNKKDTTSFLDLSNTPNPAGKQFNHTYTIFGNPLTPGDTNKQGMDLDIFDVSDKMDHAQSTTQIKFGVVKSGSHCDQIFPQVIGFSTQLYVPVFCYDYAYSQQGKYFTEDNDGSHDPKLTGTVLTGEPVQMKIFIRNLVDSDLEVQDMNVSISDINTTQATYIRNTTELAKLGNLIPQPISDSSLTVSDSKIEGIDVGDMSSNDYFYTYYQLDPKQSTLNMPIKVKATYNLKVNSTTTIPYILKLGGNVPMCSSTNFEYTPTNGLFNIVHDTYYTWNGSSGNKYYNLPTQVTNRAGNFKVIAMDPSNLDNLKDVNGTIDVAVELIDVSAFHDTFTSCKELASAISPKIWVKFKNNSAIPFDKAALIAAVNKFASIGESSTLPHYYDFYKTANENTAFRVSYDTDNNGSAFLLDADESPVGSNQYIIKNFPDLTGITCGHPVSFHAIHGALQTNVTQAATACGNAGTAISEEQYDACNECLYGRNTKLICSRDNFSIRPEAFLMHLDDQNQTNPTTKTRLTTGMSGVSGATATVLDLAADYKYNLEINATNHVDNSASPGYTRSFNIASPNDIAQYTWTPRSITASAASTNCNDENNKTLNIRFLNGYMDKNSSVAQVGEYTLNLKDTTWTTVDSNPAFMTHHHWPYFQSGEDCDINYAGVAMEGSGRMNGCNISSKHTNPDNYIVYNDYNATFHPYTFNINNIFTIGNNNITPPTTLPFVYMANLNHDENVSVHLNTTINAVGKDTTTPLSNFVSGCFEKPLDISIDKSATTNTALTYQYIFHDLNASGAILTAYDINSTIAAGSAHLNDDANLTTLLGSFQKTLNGSLQTRTNLNFNRAKNVAVNPEKITFITYKVHSNDTFQADLNNAKTADANLSLANQNIIYYYGRTNAPRKTIVCKSSPCQTNYDPNILNNQDGTRVYVFDEIYCHGTINGNTCDTSLLPAGAGHTNDTRWFINNNHDQNVTVIGSDGIIGGVQELSAANVVELNQTMIFKYQYETVLKYSGTTFPYSANMENNASDWLIYDENNAAATANKFRVDFTKEADWNGVHETNTTTHTNGALKTNRRIMW